MNTTSRSFARFSQAELYTLSKQILEYLKEDLTDFQSFDKVRFTPQFLADFHNAVLEVRDQTDDETVLDKLTGKTADVEETLAECRKAYKHYKYFVVKAFEDNVPKQNEFGLDDYETARRSQPQMIVFMGKIHRAALEYKTELMAAGYTQEQIDQLASLRDELENANFQQDSFKNKRQQITQLRHTKLDTAMRFVSQTCEAGKIIYEEENPAKYERYVMQPGSGSSTVTGIVSTTIGANKVAEISSEMSSQKIAYLSVPAGASLRYALSSSKLTSLPALEAVSVQEGETEIIGEPNKPYLYVENTGSSPVEIEYEIGRL
jgi:hypothetical protein